MGNKLHFKRFLCLDLKLWRIRLEFYKTQSGCSQNELKKLEIIQDDMENISIIYIADNLWAGIEGLGNDPDQSFQ